MDPEFEKEVAERVPGGKLPLCIQCGVCSGSCPSLFAMDYTPRQIMELIKLGLKDEVLRSRTPWICATCYVCSVRCPQGVNPKMVMEVLKQMAMEDPKYRRIEERFYDLFLDIVRRNGRMTEIGLYLKMMPISSMFRNIGIGLAFYKRGKLKLAPQQVQSLDHIRILFEKLGSKGGKES